MTSDLAQDVLAAVEIVIARQPVESIPGAIKRLRERAGLTQDELAKRFSRNRAAVAQWERGKNMPPAAMTVPLLEALGIPREQINGAVTPYNVRKLDGSAYRNNDPIDVDYQFFVDTRAEVLQDVYFRARTGSAAHAKLYKEWMTENENAIAARESSAIAVNHNGSSLRNSALKVISSGRIATSITALEVKDASNETTTGSGQAVDNEIDIAKSLETNETEKT